MWFHRLPCAHEWLTVTSTMQMTMTEIPKARKFSSNIFVNFVQQPCSENEGGCEAVPGSWRAIVQLYLFVGRLFTSAGVLAAGIRDVVLPVCIVIDPTAVQLKHKEHSRVTSPSFLYLEPSSPPCSGAHPNRSSSWSFQSDLWPSSDLQSGRFSPPH